MNPGARVSRDSRQFPCLCTTCWVLHQDRCWGQCPAQALAGMQRAAPCTCPAIIETAWLLLKISTLGNALLAVMSERPPSVPGDATLLMAVAASLWCPLCTNLTSWVLAALSWPQCSSSSTLTFTLSSDVTMQEATSTFCWLTVNSD